MRRAAHEVISPIELQRVASLQRCMLGASRCSLRWSSLRSRAHASPPRATVAVRLPRAAVLVRAAIIMLPSHHASSTAPPSVLAAHAPDTTPAHSLTPDAVEATSSAAAASSAAHSPAGATATAAPAARPRFLTEQRTKAEFEHMSHAALVEHALALQQRVRLLSPQSASVRFAPPTPGAKAQRPFDMSRHPQRHIALRVAYLGWAYVRI